MKSSLCPEKKSSTFLIPLTPIDLNCRLRLGISSKFSSLAFKGWVQLDKELKTDLGLTNLDELSFLTVLAFPKASSRGLAWMI